MLTPSRSRSKPARTFHASLFYTLGVAITSQPYSALGYASVDAGMSTGRPRVRLRDALPVNMAFPCNCSLGGPTEFWFRSFATHQLNLRDLDMR